MSRRQSGRWDRDGDGWGWGDFKGGDMMFMFGLLLTTK